MAKTELLYLQEKVKQNCYQFKLNTYKNRVKSKSTGRCDELNFMRDKEEESIREENRSNS